tara:strand:- start:32326 stop:32763 length:438 start_codon:yes stop_codon:yes gene_type:complete
MKSVTKISMTLALAMMLSFASFGDTSSLSDEQQLLLSATLEQSAENFDSFNSSLDVFQLAILESRELSNKEKFEALKASFTLEQQALWEANHVLEKAMRDDFKKSLSEDQKKDIEGTIEASLDHEQLAIIEADRIFRDLVEKDLE